MMVKTMRQTTCSKNTSRGSSVFPVIPIFILCFFVVLSLSPLVEGSPGDGWKVVLKIESSEGSGNQLTFSEKTDASDGLDDYDLPAPPFPPEPPPSVNAYFITSFEQPYNVLLNDSRKYPDTEKTWTFSVKWLNIPGDESPVNITLSWDASILAETEYTSILLQEYNTTVADMLEENSYTFTTNGSISHMFTILCSSEGHENISKDNASSDAKTSTPGFSFFLMLILVIMITIFLSWKKK